MKYSDVTKLIDACHSIACCDGNAGLTVKLLDEMAEALYKQVPQKIVCEEPERYICPRCKAFLTIGTDAAEFLCEDGAYCVDCGQRLEL